MIGAMNLEIQNLRSKNEELLKATCEKSDYDKKCEVQGAELKAVRKEKSDYKEKCEQQEGEVKAVRKEKSDYASCEQRELEAKETEEQTLKKFEKLEREKTPLVLKEDSKDHMDAIMAGSSVTNIELDITSDGELHCNCNYRVFMHWLFVIESGSHADIKEKQEPTLALKKFKKQERKVFQEKGKHAC